MSNSKSKHGSSKLNVKMDVSSISKPSVEAEVFRKMLRDNVFSFFEENGFDLEFFFKHPRSFEENKVRFNYLLNVLKQTNQVDIIEILSIFEEDGMVRPKRLISLLSEYNLVAVKRSFIDRYKVDAERDNSRIEEFFN